jgi:hypothetical protein
MRMMRTWTTTANRGTGRCSTMEALPAPPQMEDEEFWEAEEKEGEGNSERDPEPFVEGTQENQPAVSSRLGF